LPAASAGVWIRARQATIPNIGARIDETFQVGLRTHIDRRLNFQVQKFVTQLGFQI
jgi:hypothetical protein